jgi:hypothetical protein
MLVAGRGTKTSTINSQSMMNSVSLNNDKQDAQEDCQKERRNGHCSGRDAKADN